MNTCRRYLYLLRSVCRRLPGALMLLGEHMDNCPTCQEWLKTTPAEYETAELDEVENVPAI